MQAASVLVCEQLRVKERKKREEKEPYWKRHIEGDVKRLRRDLSKIEAWFKGKWKNGRKGEKEKLDRKYRLNAKGFHIVMERDQAKGDI